MNGCQMSYISRFSEIILFWGYLYLDDDYIRFCLKCYWNDSDFGCYVDSLERVYQCPLYMFYHPEEVEEFENIFSNDN